MIETEHYFWLNLRFSITWTGIVAGYCDWIEPKTYYLKSPFTLIEGKVGFLTDKMEAFKFKLIIPAQFDYQDEIDRINFNQFELNINNIALLGNTLEIHLIKN